MDFEDFVIEEHNKELERKRRLNELKYIQESKNQKEEYDPFEFAQRLNKLTKNDLIQYILYLKNNKNK